ncbi:MAG: hypothetical protein RIC56_22090 [Pseudomonadales bacterium]
MSAINVDDFCKDAARALLALYQAFPRPHTVFVEDLVGPDQIDEFGMHSERHLACFSTLLWLAEEGLMRYVDSIRQEAVDQAVLTGRAFTLLATPRPEFADGLDESLPESLRLEQQTHQYRLEQALNRRSSSEIRRAVLDLLGALQSERPRVQPELATR